MRRLAGVLCAALLANLTFVVRADCQRNDLTGPEAQQQQQQQQSGSPEHCNGSTDHAPRKADSGGERPCALMAACTIAAPGSAEVSAAPLRVATSRDAPVVSRLPRSIARAPEPPPPRV